MQLSKTNKMKYLSQARDLLWPGSSRSSSLPQPPQDTSTLADIERWKSVYSLTCEMVIVMTRIKATRNEQTARLQILLPHQERLTELFESNRFARLQLEKILIDDPKNEDTRFELERLTLGADDLGKAVRAVAKAIEVKAEDVNILENELEHLMQKTAELTEIKEVAPCIAQQITEDALLTQDMITSSAIQRLEDEYKKMEDVHFGLWGGPLTCSESERSHSSQSIDEMQRDDMETVFYKLKGQRHDLEEEDADGNRDEIEALTKQICELGDELCLRGLACKDGSAVYEDSKTFSEVFPNLGARVVGPDDNAKFVKEAEHPYQGPELFDGISDSIIEKPRSRREDGENVRWIVGEELVEFKKKIRERVSRWQDSMEDAIVLSESESNDSHAGIQDGLDSLTSVVVGETTDSAGGMDMPVSRRHRCTIDAWSRKTDRMFTELPQDAQLAHPRNATSHA